MNQQDLLHSPLLPSQITPLIQKASQNNVPVLILGEQGIGKEWVAKVIHQTGGWKYHRFHKIDCKMFKEGTLFSQLAPLFNEIYYEAVPATLFLKEVEFLSHGDQLKLLEMIEGGIFKQNGERQMAPNLRWIASSSEDLKEKANQGKFCEDLYDCLHSLSIYIPPLRDRSKDIPAIALHLLLEYATRMNLKKKGISPNVLSLLQGYWWPGNLKELKTVILRSALFSDGDNLMEKDLFFNGENEGNSFFNFLRKTAFKSPFEAKGSSSSEEHSLHWIFFLAELVHRIKNPLVSIKAFTQLLEKKFSDKEYRDSFYKIVTEDIEKIDSVINGLMDYVKMNTPLNKTNTIHRILEEVLKRYNPAFEEKKIKIFKKFEENLPETMIHDEQLRYIFRSIFLYMLPTVPPQGSIGLLTKATETPKRLKEVRSEKEEKSIEILMIFTGFKRQGATYETIFGIPSLHPEDGAELELKLIHEILKKNRGMMKMEINEKKPRTLVSLILPIEKRRVIYYPSANL
jgi:hypothetical protein